MSGIYTDITKRRVWSLSDNPTSHDVERDSSALRVNALRIAWYCLEGVNGTAPFHQSNERAR
jgi:hypothetical protein